MNNDANKSEVTQAANEVEPNQVKDNLKDDNQAPQDLSKDEETPFIDDDVRTDK